MYFRYTAAYRVVRAVYHSDRLVYPVYLAEAVDELTSDVHPNLVIRVVRVGAVVSGEALFQQVEVSRLNGRARFLGLDNTFSGHDIFKNVYNVVIPEHLIVRIGRCVTAHMHLEEGVLVFRGRPVKSFSVPVYCFHMILPRGYCIYYSLLYGKSQGFVCMFRELRLFYMDFFKKHLTNPIQYDIIMIPA